MEHNSSNHVGSMSATDSARIQIGNNSTINNTTNNYSQDDDEKYLAALSLTDPRQDKSRIEQTNGDLLKEAYLWVLQNPEFKRWRETSEGPPLLWIRGDPGKGKTMLLSGIINELQPSTRLKDPTRHTDPTSHTYSTSHTSLSYFFCQATNPGLNNATAVLRGLVYLLVDQHPDLLSHVRGKLPLDPGHWNSGIAIRAIFLEMLQDRSLQNVILIVDALDECETDMRFLLEVITATMSHQVRWLVSSRNIRMIETILTQAQTKVVLSLELNAQSVGQAISEYIQHRMGRLGSRINLNDEELRSTSSYLYENAHGTFLWVALVCRQLETCNEWEVKDLLERPPQGLDELYERMIQRIRHSNSANLYVGILSFVFTVYRPITFAELAIIKDLPRSDGIVPNMIMECGGFLTSRDEVIYLVHQSAKDFLAKQQDILFPSGLTQHHLGLFDACLNSLNVLRMDIYGQVYPGVRIHEPDFCRPKTDPLSGLSYSCEFWAHHLRDSQPFRAQEISNCNKAHQFIAHKFLFWLEALSLLGNLPAAMETLQILKDLPLGGETLALVEDTRRFFLYFSPIIEDYPLQIYASGLIFSPEESLIRHHFEHCSPKFVVKKPRVDAQWRTSFHVPAWNYDLTFSTDNKSLGTTNSRQVTKWKVSDGTEIMSAHCDGLDFITPSPDLNLFAGVTIRQQSSDVEVHIDLQIRSLESNSIKWSRDLGNRQVMEVEFSPDSQWLAVCFDEELVLWGFEKNDWKGWPLGVPFKEYQRMRFSSDGALVAFFGSADMPSRRIVVLDVRTGEQHKNPSVEIGKIFSAVFLPNTHKIMMCGKKGVWSWDIVGGECEEWLGSEDFAQHTIASSHNASWIALASETAVFLCGGENHELLQRFELPSTEGISSIAVSFDDRRLAVSSDETVEIYDITSSTSKQTPYDWDAARKVFFSDDRSLMAWALEKKIQVLEATTGIHLCEFDMPWFWGTQSLKRYSTDDNLAAFSPNGRMLAASSSSSRSSSLLRVWDLAGQRLLQEIEVPDSIRQLAVSHDGNNCGRWVAAIKTPQNIYVWDDATTRRPRWSLEHTGHKSPITLQFCDGKLVVLWALGDDYSLTYYNVTNGTRLTHVEFPSHPWYPPEQGFSLSPSGERATWPSENSELQIIFISHEEGGIRMAPLSIISWYISRLSFLNDSTFLTNQGMLDVDAMLAEATIEANTPHNTFKKNHTSGPAFIGYGINKYGDWITLDGHDLIWLPPHYRLKPGLTVKLSSGERHFAMHCPSGVFFMQFSQDTTDLLHHI